MAKRGLYANIHAKKKRIKAGSGEKNSLGPPITELRLSGYEGAVLVLANDDGEGEGGGKLVRSRTRTGMVIKPLPKGPE